jgi:4-diphosphocytidyl-2C-methyl-D-erythritol kinase
MVYYQVSARFVFAQGKSALVSAHIKKHRNAAAHLVHFGLLSGSGLKVGRFFRTQKEAARYVSYLRTVYKNRVISNTPLAGGQLVLF